MSKIKAPMVIKVSVSHGQARISLPKNVALHLNLLNEDGKPGEVRYLLLKSGRSFISLTPVEMTEVESEEKSD